MTSERLDSLLKHRQPSDDIDSALRPEIESYINSVLAKKSSIILPGDFAPDWVLSRTKLIGLLTAYVNDSLHQWDLEYIFKILELHCEVEDQRIEQVLFNFSDAYLGYPITQNNARNAISYLVDKTVDLNLESGSNPNPRAEYRSIFKQ